jgi:hypothetical protein
VIKKSQEIPLDAFRFIALVEVNECHTTEAYSNVDPLEIKMKYQEADKKKRKTLWPELSPKPNVLGKHTVFNLVDIKFGVSVCTYLTFRGRCSIVKYSYNKSHQDALFLNPIVVKISTCFGQTYCPSPGVLIVYSQHWYLSYYSSYVGCLLATPGLAGRQST